ncbi:hypothetical protein AN933_23480 [Mycobacterium intracellulare subsp. chimaera]|nr:hypothetical protein AN933_23480 [Mycobacterium intracellulare subsp. chimaera]OBF16435.1 hypothetical protein A5725_25180 [Mycobacterium kubicae]
MQLKISVNTTTTRASTATIHMASPATAVDVAGLRSSAQTWVLIDLLCSWLSVVCQLPVGQPAWLVVNAAYCAVALQDQ